MVTCDWKRHYTRHYSNLNRKWLLESSKKVSRECYVHACRNSSRKSPSDFFRPLRVLQKYEIWINWSRSMSTEQKVICLQFTTVSDWFLLPSFQLLEIQNRTVTKLTIYPKKKFCHGINCHNGRYSYRLQFLSFHPLKLVLSYTTEVIFVSTFCVI